MASQLRPLFGEPLAQDFLQGAIEVAKFLQSKAIKTDQGTTWPEQPLLQTEHEAFLGRFSLYSGNTGIVYFFLQLAEATKEEQYIQEAVEGANYIVNTWDNGSYIQSYGTIDKSHLCMVNGIAGVSYVISLVASATNSASSHDFAVSLTDEIVKSVSENNGEFYWTNDPGVVFDSGLILFLLQMAKTYSRPDWRALAIKVGYSILNKAIRVNHFQQRWPHVSPSSFGIPEDSIIPNFFYGTSGVAFTLATLYEESNETPFLEAAVEGANYIQAIATLEDDKALIPHSLPHLHDVHYLGLCHGAAGTIRLFYKLYKITQDKDYKQWIEKIVNGVVATGAPELHSVGYWNTTCQCCGSAGLSNMFLGLWAEFKEERYLNYAKRVGKHLLSESAYEQCGVYWYQAWDRKSPDVLTAKTGYYDGAAGNGLELLHIYLASIGQFNILRLPEDPYPTK